jgi:phage/plasmid-like protein (TIGR03299 family)
MAYVGETPWHGLGSALDVAPASIAEAIRAAGLDWTVRREQLRMADGRLVDRFAVVRDSDNRVLGTVGSDWRPIQNAHAFSVIEPFLTHGQATVETAGSLFQGGRVWMLLRIARPDAVIVPQADDRVAKYILAAVGHDGTLSFTLGITPIRVVCNNTLSASLGAGLRTHVKVRHTAGGVDAVTALADTIDRVDAQIEKAAEVFRALAGINITSAAQLRAYVDAVFPAVKRAPKALAAAPTGDTFADLLGRPVILGQSATTFEGAAPMLAEQATVASVDASEDEDVRRIFGKIENLFEHGRGNRAAGVRHTAWSAYNAVTEYNTWERGQTSDNRLNNVWLSQSGSVARALPAAVNAFLSA